MREVAGIACDLFVWVKERKWLFKSPLVEREPAKIFDFDGGILNEKESTDLLVSTLFFGPPGRDTAASGWK